MKSIKNILMIIMISTLLMMAGCAKPPSTIKITVAGADDGLTQIFNGVEYRLDMDNKTFDDVKKIGCIPATCQECQDMPKHIKACVYDEETDITKALFYLIGDEVYMPESVDMVNHTAVLRRE